MPQPSKLRLTLLSILPIIAIGSLSASTAFAGDGGKLSQTGLSCRCPICDHHCELTVDETEEKRTCYEIETKIICIPRVVFPWQKKKHACSSCSSCDGAGCTSCVHNGAKLRRVCVAKPKEYKCPACKFTWKAEKNASCCEMVNEEAEPVVAKVQTSQKGDTFIRLLPPIVIPTGSQLKDLQVDELKSSVSFSNWRLPKVGKTMEQPVNNDPSPR
ncbi:MAG: hypothetical protein AAF802_10345 [Planctomycetota bacterium]